MTVTVIYPSDYVGGKAQTFLYLPKAPDVAAVLEEVRGVFQDPELGGLPASLRVRMMLIGDVIKVDEKFFIVTPQSFREVPEVSAQNWLKRTLVERMIGSGMHAKVSGEHMKINL